MKIYYVYRKDDGEYAGSGTPKIENETHASTTAAIPEYDSETQGVFWENKKWKIKEL